MITSKQIQIFPNLYHQSLQTVQSRQYATVNSAGTIDSVSIQGQIIIQLKIFVKNLYVIKHTHEHMDAVHVSPALGRGLLVVHNLFKGIGQNVPIDSLYLDGYGKTDAIYWEGFCKRIRAHYGSNADTLLTRECLNSLSSAKIRAFGSLFRTLLLNILKASSQGKAQLQETDIDPVELDGDVGRNIFTAWCEHNDFAPNYRFTKDDTTSLLDYVAWWRDQKAIRPNMRTTAGENNLLLIGSAHRLEGLDEDFTTHSLDIIPTSTGITVVGSLPSHLKTDVLDRLDDTRSQIAEVLLQRQSLNVEPNITFI